VSDESQKVNVESQKVSDESQKVSDGSQKVEDTSQKVEDISKKLNDVSQKKDGNFKFYMWSNLVDFVSTSQEVGGCFGITHFHYRINRRSLALRLFPKKNPIFLQWFFAETQGSFAEM